MIAHHELLAAGSAAHDHGPGRRDPRVKLAVALSALLALALATHLWLPGAGLVVCLAALVTLGVPLSSVLRRLLAPMGLAAFLWLLRTFMTGSTPWVSFHLGPWLLTATREGFADGGLIACRIVASVSVVILLCAFTLMYRYTFTLFEQAQNVLAAQTVRLGHAGYRRSLASIGSLAGIVTLQSIDQAERTHEAMLARGYQGTLSLPTLRPLRRSELARIAGGLAAISLAYWLAERWLP
ncbi:MAG: energy-coupling factor transporter transmembrane component T [Thermoguttaceae bacterium]